MTARCFADTNLFLYAASNDCADAAKKKIARELIALEDIGLELFSAETMSVFSPVLGGRFADSSLSSICDASAGVSYSAAGRDSERT